MRPHELVAQLLKQRKLSAYAAAKAMHGPSFQPTLHKFLHGEVESPNHSTAKRIADFLDLPVEAIYDNKAATRIAQERGLLPASSHIKSTDLAEAKAVYKVPRRQELPLATRDRIATLSTKQLNALVHVIDAFLEGIAPEAAHSKRRQA